MLKPLHLLAAVLCTLVSYLLSTGTYKFYFPGLKIFDVVLKVNSDKYRVYPERINVKWYT